MPAGPGAVMLAILDPRIWLAVSIACAVSYGAGRWQQWRADEREAVAELAIRTAQVLVDERDLAVKHELTRGAHATELHRLSAAHAAVLDELRERPRRLPAPAAAACAGTSGAELSRDDAQFLAGFAHERDNLLAAVRACEKRERDNFESVNGG